MLQNQREFIDKVFYCRDRLGGLQLTTTFSLFRFGMLGGCRFPALGTFATYVAVSRDEVLRTPAHLDDVRAAGWPLGGVTAWR